LERLNVRDGETESVREQLSVSERVTVDVRVGESDHDGVSECEPLDESATDKLSDPR
jgi:hypothetical protein